MTDNNQLPPLPPYIYGREAGENEKVWTEDAVYRAIDAALAQRQESRGGVEGTGLTQEEFYQYRQQRKDYEAQRQGEPVAATVERMIRAVCTHRPKAEVDAVVREMMSCDEELTLAAGDFGTIARMFTAPATAEQPAETAQSADFYSCANAFSQTPGKCATWCGDDRTCPQHPKARGEGSGVAATAPAPVAREPLTDAQMNDARLAIEREYGITPKGST